MARYTIDFSTNASAIVQELDKIITAVGKVEKAGSSVTLDINSSQFNANVSKTFKQLNKEIERTQRQLNKLQIGGGAFTAKAELLGAGQGQKEKGQLLKEQYALRGQAQAFEPQSLIRSEKALRSLQIQASLVAPNTKEWIRLQQLIGNVKTELNKADQAAQAIQLRDSLGAFNPGSLNQLSAKLQLLRIEANAISPDTTRWKQLNQEIQKAEGGIAKVNKKPLSTSQRAGAAGGAFLYGGGLGGGMGSAFGGITGGLLGGVPGAFTGAAIGQVADNLGQALAGITDQAAGVQRMQRGLAMASVDAKDFAEAQSTVAAMSQRILMPLEQTTRLFTQLRVNTKQYNLSVAETAKIMEGTALAISATGGSADDMEGAMRAVVQILSKGGVQAEELRGQLGERFPGAVVKFAQANKLSFEELQEGLEQGTIGIKEFVAFANKNYTDYAEFSKKLATAPEFAGRRLAIAFEQMQVAIGSLFTPLGSGIQDALTQAINGISSFVKDNKVFLTQFMQDFGSIVGPIIKVFAQILGVVGKFALETGKVFQTLFGQMRQAMGMATIGSAKARLDIATEKIKGKTRVARVGKQGDLTDASSTLGAQILRQVDPFVEFDNAKKEFKKLGGQAAYNKSQQTTATDYTFGGPGAGMSMDRAAGTGNKKSENDKLKQFTNDRIEILKTRLDAEKAFVDASLDLSNRERDIKKAQIDFNYGNQIIDEQLAQAQRESLQYQVQDRARFIAEQAQLGAIQRKTLTSQFQTSVAGGLVNYYETLKNTYDELSAALEALKSGKSELNEVDKAGLLINQITKGLTKDQLSTIQPLIDKTLALAAATGAVNSATKQQNALIALQNQLKLAQIIDPKKELREQLKQANPELSPMQIEEQASLQEKVNQAQKIKDQFKSIASSIGDSFGEAFKGIITGTSTVQQAFANLFQSVADSFADMVAKMIAEWLKTQLLQGFQSIFSALIPGIGGAVAGAAGGSLSGAFGAGGPTFNPGAFSMPSLIGSANGNVLAGGFQAFADGGIVSGPTLGLVGEGRYNEAVIPMPNGRSVPVDLGGAMGGDITSNIVVNVNNGQAQSNGTGGNASDFGRKMEGAVKQVIVNELRPGGVLARR